jgi:hypothetical protein
LLDYIDLQNVLQREMQKFTEKIVGMMKSEHLFESQGGPIILSQVNFLELLNFFIIFIYTYICNILKLLIFIKLLRS